MKESTDGRSNCTTPRADPAWQSAIVHSLGMASAKLQTEIHDNEACSARCPKHRVTKGQDCSWHHKSPQDYAV